MLAKLISDYQSCALHDLDRHLNYYSQCSNWEEACQRAGRFEEGHSRTERSDPTRKHPHQRRVTKAAAAQFFSELQLLRKPDSGVTFSTLHEKIDRIGRRVKGISFVTIYDTALRLGAHLKIEPEEVYLHAGALDGAKAFFLRTEQSPIKKSGPVARKRFCPELQELSAKQIENFLCICKDALQTGRLPDKSKLNCNQGR